MADKTFDIVVGETGVDYDTVWEDQDKQPINITGATLTLKGTSEDITHTFNIAGTVFSGPEGIQRNAGIGGVAYIQISDLGERNDATYTLEAKMVDTGGKVRYAKPRNKVRFMKPLID